MRHPPAAFCGGPFRGALLALGTEVAFSFPLFFAPGWANGWPGGLTIHQVWSTWLTATLLVMLMTSGIAIGSLICLLFSGLSGRQRYARVTLVVWIGLWVVLSAVACLRIFPEVYASARQMWPNGYPG